LSGDQQWDHTTLREDTVKIGDLAEDTALGAVSGYVGTKVMEPVSMKLYQWESEEHRTQEDEVRPGPPFQLAAQKTAHLLGIKLSDQQLQRASMGFHYGLAMSWAPLYALIRRRWHTPVAATALGSGAAMSLIVDEGLTPTLGFSAPNRAYPMVTHVRGFVAHLAYGAAVAAVIEAGWCLRGRRP
jgi:uncharacterized membrane protein YagU involved in acid resistance